jgi:ribokinase
MSNPKICVVGSSNFDLVCFAPRLPKLGETLHGDKFIMVFGGKGANQAVTAARLGGEVTMVTKLGEDIFGRDTLKNFETQGMDSSFVFFTTEAKSGVAAISVDADGHNSIIIVGGANNLLSPVDIETARSAIESAQVLVCQLEIPLESTLAALRIARAAGVTTIFNSAPARSDLPDEIFALSDIFCPNETETELLTGLPVDTLENAESAARTLIQRGCGKVILTLGVRGSLLVTPQEVIHVETKKVKAIDTTGAGDSFVGSLAFFLAQGKPLQKAMKKASQIAAISVQSEGAQTSFPTAKDLPPGIL